MTPDPWWAQLALWGVVALPALAGTALCGLGMRARPAAGLVSVTTVVLTAAATLIVIIERPAVTTAFAAGLPFGLGADLLSSWVLATVITIALAVLGFATFDVRRAPARFHGLMLLFVSAVMLTAVATTLPSLLFGWELMGAASFALIGFAWDEPGKTAAGMTAFLTTRAADLGLYIATGAALAGGGGVALERLTDAEPSWRHVIAAGILIAALGKAAQLPFSFWLSSAMEGPAPVSALLHSAAMVAMGGYLLLRVSGLLEVTGWAMWVAAWVGAVTALVLGIIACAQQDLKQLLAASTSAQIGFIVLAAGVGSVSGGTAQLVAHASTKAGLFLVAGAWLSTVGTKRLDELRGIGRLRPLEGVSATVLLLALGGVAPLSLWATKDDVLAVVADRSMVLYLVATAAAWVSAAYAARVLVIIWGRPRQEPDGRASSAGWGRLTPIGVLTAGSVLLGLTVLPPWGSSFRSVFGDGDLPRAHAGELAISATAALLIVVAVARWPEVLERRTQWARSWLGMDALVQRLVVQPAFATSRALARFDDRVLAAGADSVARFARSTGVRTSRFDTSVIDGVVRSLAAATRRAGNLARAPQTGQVHQYYAQVVVLIALLAVALIGWELVR